MNAPMTITTVLDAETLTLVDQLALARGISGSDYVAEAVRRVAESEADFAAFIQEGIDSADRGELIDNDVVMAELDEMIEKHRNR